MLKTDYNIWIELWPFSFGPPDLGGQDGIQGKLKNCILIIFLFHVITLTIQIFEPNRNVLQDANRVI